MKKKKEAKHAMVKAEKAAIVPQDNRVELLLQQNAELRKHILDLRAHGRPDFRDIVYYSNLSCVPVEQEENVRASTLVRWIHGATEKLADCAEIEKPELRKVIFDSCDELEKIFTKAQAAARKAS
jgi:hypothetical protein